MAFLALSSAGAVFYLSEQFLVVTSPSCCYSELLLLQFVTPSYYFKLLLQVVTLSRYSKLLLRVVTPSCYSELLLPVLLLWMLLMLFPQVMVVPVMPMFNDYANELQRKLHLQGIAIDTDLDDGFVLFSA